MYHISPWTLSDLLPSVDEKLNAFNDLFLTCLDSHAPVRTTKIKRKPGPFITGGKKKLISKRNNLDRSVRRSESSDEWKAFKYLGREIKLVIKNAENKLLQP